jgi:toxin YoeB
MNHSKSIKVLSRQKMALQRSVIFNMNKLFTDESWDDLESWFKKDRKMYRRIFQLIKDIDRDPFEGIGKPEPLKENLSGHWSRRINDEHRLVYKVDDENITIVQCMFYY